MLRFLVVPALLALCGLARAQSCGDVLLHDVVLGHDLSCTSAHAYGLAVGAPGITIDLGGHTLQGTFGRGIEVTGASGVKVRNGRIRGFGVGIAGTGAHDLVVEDVVLEDMHNGIGLDDAAHVRLRGNHFQRLDGTAIALEVFSPKHRGGGHDVSANLVQDAGAGIILCGYETGGSLVADNQLFGLRYDGIHFYDGSGGNLVAGNTIGDARLAGIQLRGSSNNEITGNVIKRGINGIALVPEPPGYCAGGPVVGPQVTGNLVDGNSIFETDMAVELGVGAGKAGTVFDNKVQRNKLYYGGVGVLFNSDAHDNDATGNAYAGTTTPVVDHGSGNAY
jgi:nitrous oxidase accessory protein NosD